MPESDTEAPEWWSCEWVADKFIQEGATPETVAAWLEYVNEEVEA